MDGNASGLILPRRRGSSINQREDAVDVSLDIYQPGILELNKHNNIEVYGFQFEIHGCEVVGVTCPWFDYVVWNGNTVFGLSLTHQPIPEGIEKMVEIDYTNPGRIARCLDLVLSDGSGFEFQIIGRRFTMLPTTQLDPFGHEIAELPSAPLRSPVSAGTIPGNRAK